MFLKRIELQGFKSFADKTVINFDHSVTGVVGPNGCGKSNISDAIRWVLGEQSVKSMRGSSMTDIIFNGSEKRRRVNLAEVTLVFDNAEKPLNSDFEEVEVTRRLYRDTRESEYLINKTPCRLRDIHDLVMDTGLGRDSLSIISQGSISFFAEAKPQERRMIFEEAAGVAKYKRRKIESISKLERTQENIERMQDIVEEIEKQVSPLRRAAKKAKIFLEKKDALEAIEVSVLVSDISTFRKEIDETNTIIYDLEAQVAQTETQIGVLEHELESSRQEGFILDQGIVKSQEKMMSLVREIGILEARKIEIEEKRKYTLEVGNAQERANELYALLNDAKLEYKERFKRHELLKAEVDLHNQATYENNRVILDIQQKIDMLKSQRQSTLSRLDVLKHRLERPYEHQYGVQTIMNNKHSISGIHDTVGNLLLPLEGYELAISTALGGATNHVVTDDDKAAVHAIQFLKRNRSGRATFIPLTVVKPRSANHDVLTIAHNTQGFKGIASDFVEVDARYSDLSLSFMGDVYVFDTIEHANTLAKRVNYNAKIVTLDGDVIHRGGTMSGGQNKNQSNSIAEIRRDIDRFEETIKRNDIELDALNVDLTHIKNKHLKDNELLMEKRIALAQIEPLLDVKRSKYESLKSDYDALELESDKNEKLDDDVITQLNRAYMERDELTSKLSLDHERRLNLSNEIQRKELTLRQHRQDLNGRNQLLNNHKMTNVKRETQCESLLERLSSEYQMTFEYASENVFDGLKSTKREEVLLLRDEISKLGNVNLDAPEEYEAINERYEFLTTQLHDLTDSRQKLLDIIEEMDEIMSVQFKEMFDKINQELSAVFTQLFNGGKAKLVLEDPDDLLNTGVDIDVQPPGKSVQNIRLFSGGEKSLIAISVLFSILKARHVPLCIFDEVEAALDQVNVERLATYIQSLSDDTQFIVITHRSGTMERCDVLYGVTMPTQGVSSLLKVQLEEAIELKEEVTNGAV
ncbi:chromosome segregation protein SMC [Erysipelothrix larvae]|uniref:Chromosome partition protein Smc n=1 Tax=Erysipelothrix larvae TaxID=1514105 RepID=A0A0X8GZI6_9FIRM|nr:chromosome segregation protein SMC [Erysipelothrix larvae]AMC93296.1 chromosome segregation protein SMC [Erysipelothrix larvae]